MRSKLFSSVMVLPLALCTFANRVSADFPLKSQSEDGHVKRSLDYSNGLPIDEFVKQMNYWKDQYVRMGKGQYDNAEWQRRFAKFKHYNDKWVASKEGNSDEALDQLAKHQRKMMDGTLAEEKRARQPEKADAWAEHICKD